ISQRTGLPTTSVHRLLHELEDLGLVDRTDHGYSLGRVVFELGAKVPLHADLVAVVQPYLQDLYEATHHSIQLGIRCENDVLIVDQIRGHSSVTAATRIGERYPQHSLAIGKALLAHDGRSGHLRLP